MQLKTLMGWEWAFSLNQDEQLQLITTFLENGELGPVWPSVSQVCLWYVSVCEQPLCAFQHAAWCGMPQSAR